MSKSRSAWRWPRWFFIALIVTAVTIITVRTVDFLNEAQMSLGLNRVPSADITGKIINQQRFDPPPDSIMRPSQLHVALRIAEGIDSLTKEHAKPSRMNSFLADIMNEHMTSRSSYAWTRKQITRALTRTPVSHVDTVHVELIRMVRPRFEAVQRVYRDTLDRMLIP